MSEPNPKTKLFGYVEGDATYGSPLAVLATSFDLDAMFFEQDFLPGLLKLPTWGERTVHHHVQAEQALAEMAAFAVLVEGRRYAERPRSLRVRVTPAVAKDGGMLHAKVLLIVHDAAVRFIVSSANLTTAGYRHNREVAVPLMASKAKPAQAPLIREALLAMPDVLAAWWNDDAARSLQLALDRLEQWSGKAGSPEERFVWSTNQAPLWRTFVDQWPAKERIKEISIVSPFWSEEDSTGAVNLLLKELREAGAALDGANIHLHCRTQLDHQGRARPELPYSFRTASFPSDVRVVAHATDPVDTEEDRSSGLARGLHAKVVLVRGTRSVLSYAGSANFTLQGWGFDPSGSPAHIEAGLIQRRTAQAGARLALVPPSWGEPVELRGDGDAAVAEPSQDGEGVDLGWPFFVRSIELTHSADQHVSLTVELDMDSLPETWKIKLRDASAEPALTLANVQRQEVALSQTDVRHLLRNPILFVEWGTSKGIVPLNVTSSLRERIPFSPEGRPASRQELLDFFAGRAPRLFDGAGDPDDPHDSDGGQAVSSEVDTSQILTYQVREFVYALPGLHQRLLESLEHGTETTIRLALLGPMSPTALAQRLMQEHRDQEAATALAFQLTELLACIRTVEEEAEIPDSVDAAAQEALSKAREELAGHLQAVRSRFHNLGEGSPFSRYADRVLNAEPAE